MLEDFLEDKVENKFYFNNDKIENFLKENKMECIKQIESNEIVKLFDLPKEICKDLERQRRVYSIKGISPTVLGRTDSAKICISEGNQLKIRKLTPKECFRLMGLNDSDINKIEKVGISNSSQYRLSGNSIVINILNSIHMELFKGEKDA